MKKLLILWGILGVLLLSGCKEKSEEVTKYDPKLPTGVEEAEVFVAPVEGISDDFYRGVDISTVLVEEKSGAKYYNTQGVEEDVFKILADAGVNCVRVRVWNDPYDENGNGYGGGNCDYKNAAEIGRRAAEYGMKTMIDFHYSDFWADPGKQMCPKAWVGMSGDEKGEAAYAFTLEAMDAILAAGANVCVVQLGNETNHGMAGETKWVEINKIVSGGTKAISEMEEKYQIDIKTAVHFTNPENKDSIKSILRKLKNCDVEYDIFALSYYPYWHGTLDNLKEVMTLAKEQYGKEVMVVENAYMFTTEDGDGNGNSVSEEQIHKNYAATWQSQANEVRDVCEAVSEVGGLGVFYWEPAWIPVDKSTWETEGSGWASSYAGAYDPKDAGVYYGGCAWENQAMFDFDGKALPSINVWKYLKYGSTAPLKIDYVKNLTKTVNPGSALTMPETADVFYNDRSKNGPAKVNWDPEDVSKVDTGKPGEYTVKGTFEDGTDIECVIKVESKNWIENASFEDEPRNNWEFQFSGDPVLDYQQKESDAYTGEWAMHYWRQGEVEFTANYTFEDLEDGDYFFSVYTQGGDAGAGADMFIFAQVGDQVYREDFTVDGWCVWQHPEIQKITVSGGKLTVGVHVKAGAGAWGTFDDFYLCKLD